jgi:hypothetical protein
MDARYVVHACSNAHVAQAAVFSIGGDFVVRFASEARRNQLDCGPFAARLVQDFERRADADAWGRANKAAAGAELPVLTCLRFILDRSLAASRRESCAAN